jgi:hypothetical protein
MNATMITREKFVERVGREPEQDDLERCNCQHAGEIGHLGCGWNSERDLPQFMVGVLPVRGTHGIGGSA